MKPEYGIIEFFENSSLLNIKTLSPAQKMTLKAVMGEPLDTKNPIPKSHPYQEVDFANEVEMFKYFSGKTEYVPTFYPDPDLCFGRRSGKSTSLGAGLAIYFATQFDYKPYLGTSPHATIPIISPSKDQANEVYQSIKSFFMRSPYLFKKYLGGEINNFQEEYSEEDMKDSRVVSGGTIKLTGVKVVIKVMAADISKIRGIAVPFAILDEVNFFGAEGNDLKNTDRGIYEALSPALAQFTQIPGMAMILKISSPNGQSGLMYDDYENRTEVDVLHLQIPSWYANPSLSLAYLEKQKKKGIAFFQREYGAQYTASETSYLDPALVDAAIIRGIDKIDYQPAYRYAAVMDYATKKDYWAFGIGHKEDYLEADGRTRNERVQADLLTHWRGTDGAELDPSVVIPEICRYLKQYKVNKCYADQYAFAALKPYFQAEGIVLEEFKVTMQSKVKYFYSLQVGINSGRFKLVNNPIAIKHLKDLREKRAAGTNHLRIEAAHGCHDDYANVCGLIQYQFDSTSPIYIGIHKVETDGLPQTRDLTGQFISTPTANDLAELAGVSGFYDNTKEVEEKEKDKNAGKDEDDDSWFII